MAEVTSAASAAALDVALLGVQGEGRHTAMACRYMATLKLAPWAGG